MREIKFRVWHGDKMEYNIDVSGGRKMLFEHGNFVAVLDAPIMQYTGLKDKNGVEIYEGDIVQYSDYDRAHEDFYTNKGVVEYAGFGFHFTNRHDVDMDDIDMDDVLVIGNTHEHPNLLKNDN